MGGGGGSVSVGEETGAFGVREVQLNCDHTIKAKDVGKSQSRVHSNQVR